MNRRRFVAVAVTAAVAARDAVAAETTRISLRVAGGKLAEGPRVIRLKRNANVVLTVIADTADELHVHGYNLHLKLLPNQAATLSFVAKHTGRFTFELHDAGTDLGVFEIYPE